MKTWLGVPGALAFAVVLACPCLPTAWGQNDRRGRFEPGLIVETGARLGACDALKFTRDGRFLLAAGDDKVVRSWRVTEQEIDAHSLQTLRWSTWREQRGAIYALAMSPDPEERFVAIAGYGVRTGSVVVLQRATGKVEHALLDPKGNDKVIWALGFSPSGKQLVFGTDDGTLWLWNLDTGKENDVVKLGQSRAEAGINRVRLIEFLTATQVLSVAQDGKILQWDTARPGPEPRVLGRFELPNLFRVAITPDRKWLAASGENAEAGRTNRVEVRTVDGSAGPRLPALPEGSFPHCLTFDARGERLAVGVRSLDLKAKFYRELDGNVLVYDLRHPADPRVAVPRTSLHAEALAFHPDGQRLAIAGGADHEVALWKIEGDRAGPVGEPVRSPGSGLWSVALSTDGKLLGYREQRNPAFTSPNQRGAGDWRVFDLRNPQVGAGPRDFQPVEPLESAGGWTVQFTPDAYVWQVQGPNNVRHTLPLDRWRDAMPQCWTFLKPENGKPIRLAVGHYWGASIFELTEQQVRRVRLLTGHQGEVTALGVSADGKLLVSASRDQTIAGWSLADWPSQPELGAAFTIQQGKLLTTAVDPGSPAWEAGLSKGDEIVFLAFDAKAVAGGPEQWLDRLRRPVPGREFFFRWKRAGQAQPMEQLTTVRQRPLWRFFPMRDGEWIVWRWRDYYYDTSTNGDYFVGWQVSGDVNKTPEFYKAEQFRRRFHQPRKVAEALAGSITDIERTSLVQIEPPEVKLELSAREVADAPVTVSLSVTPRGALEDQRPGQVILWVNDFQFQTWDAGGKAFQQKVIVPPDRLRDGNNLISVQCYNQAGGRGEISPPTSVQNRRANVKPNLYGLFVAIGKYEHLGLANLKADQDCKALRDVWLRQEKALYGSASIDMLLDEEATRAKILAHLRQLATQVKADDQLVLFFGGHGASANVIAAVLKEKKQTAVEAMKPDNYVYCCHDFDAQRPLSTGLTTQDLYGILAKVPCHKLVLLDACRSGTTVEYPVRHLTRDGVGPVIFAASKPGQDAQEDRFGLLSVGQVKVFGLFTLAISQALEKQFDRADKNRDGKLEAGELFDFLQGEVPSLLSKLTEDPKIRQNPTRFLPVSEERRPLARKPE